jgi:hypothetical protein
VEKKILLPVFSFFFFYQFKISLDDFVFNLKIKSISFPGAPCFFEPLHFTVSLYDPFLQAKITEDFLFEYNNNRNSDTATFIPSEATPSASAIFSFCPVTVRNVYIVIHVYRFVLIFVLHNFNDFL